MENTVKKRPIAVSILGGIFIGLGILAFLVGMMGVNTFVSTKQLDKIDFSKFGIELPDSFKPFLFISQNYDLFTVLQIIIATFVVIAGIYFLQLQAWTRTALEVVCWIGVAIVLVYSLLWGIAWLDITSQVPQGSDQPSVVFSVFGVFIIIMSMAMYFIPLIVIIFVLRKKSLREAFI